MIRTSLLILALVVGAMPAAAAPRRVRAGKTTVTVVDEASGKRVDDVFARMKRRELKQQRREERAAEKAERRTAKQRKRALKKAGARSP